MKKYLILFAGILALSSCMKDKGNSLNYNLQATFDYDLSTIADYFKDSLYIVKDYQEGMIPALGWQDLAFFYKIDAVSKEIVGGSRISYARDSIAFKDITPETVFPKYWSVYAKKGVYSVADNGFMLYYANPSEDNMPEHDIVFMNSNLGTCTPYGCLVNNTSQVVKAVKEHFTKGDYLKLTATGYLNKEKTGTAELFLANYTEAKDSVVTNWTKLDFSKLGSDIDYIDFNLESTKTEIPPYFCYDLLTASIALKF